MDDGGMRKSPEQVAAEYDAAEDTEEWFVAEVGDFFAPDADDDDARIERLESVFDRLEDEREEFIAGSLDGSDLLGVDIEFARQGRDPYESGCFRVMPSPVVLLEMCNCIADPGDEVVVRHRYANGWVGEFSATWPFGMDDAVDLTAPLAERLAALDDDDDDDDDARAGRVSDGPTAEASVVVASAAAVVAAGAALLATAAAAASFLRRPR